MSLQEVVSRGSQNISSPLKSKKGDIMQVTSCILIRMEIHYTTSCILYCQGRIVLEVVERQCSVKGLFVYVSISISE